MATERYSLGHHESVLRTHEWRTVENSASYVEPFLQPGLRVLDVGSGPGTISIDLACRVAGDGGEVIGVDASNEVVDRARLLATDRGVDNVRFSVGDVYALDVEDESIDIVHAHQVLQHLADPVRALLEIKRVLRPGGIVAVRDVVYSAASWYPRLDGLTDWMSVYQTLTRRNGGDPDAGASNKARVMDAGFDVVYSGAAVWGFTDVVDREWWGRAWAERSRESSFALQAREYGIATPAQLEAISDAWLSWSADERAWFAVPHGEAIGRKP